MVLRLAELTCDDNEWNQIVKGLPGGQLFHTAEWLRLLERNFGVVWRKIGIYADKRLVGVYPLLAQRKAFFRLGASPLRGWATPYLGPVLEEAYWSRLPLKLRRFLRRHGYDYTEMVVWGTDYQEQLTAAGYVCETRYTYVNDLSNGPEALWKELRCRTDVRKAVKNGLVIEESDDAALLETYYELAVDTYRPHKRPPSISIEMINDVWATFRPLGQVKLWVVKHEDEPIAFEMVLYYNGQIYYWDAVAKRDTLKLRPSNLSTWAIMEAGAKAGYQEADLVGANVPGIAKFKKSFGGTLVPYTYAYCYLSPLAKLGRYAYSKGMPLVRQLQHWVTELRAGQQLDHELQGP